MKAILQLIQKRYREWQERRFLAAHGCETREQYDYRYDPGINRRANIVKDFYHGYPYVYCFTDHRHLIYYWDLGYDGTFELRKWCEGNCTDKYRFDFHRVLKTSSTSNEWAINEIGGGDYIFFACKNPKDYTLFLLRWS
jgi:hypothetical protein